MLKFSERKGSLKSTNAAIGRYPDSGLKQPVHDYDSTFSAVTVLKEMFFSSKD